MNLVSIKINGTPVQTLVEPRTHLGDFLRDQQRLTGTHLGCEHGVCGSCTVLLDGVPVRSCISYAVACDGREVRTIEGFDDDALMNRLREAFSREHGLQCGFCTPGMLITSHDICQRFPGADEQRIRVELSGNLCRCTGYVGIVNAVKSVAAQLSPEIAVDDLASVTRSELPRVLQAFEPVVKAPPATAQSGVPANEREEGGDRKGWIRIDERLVIAHPPALVWKTLSDLPAATACLPGAELTEHSQESAKGRIRIKFGPMSASFSGAATIERDDAALRAVIRGAGVDNLSNSRARGDIAYRLRAEEDGRATRVDIALDYALTGPLAQFSRSGLVQDFARKLIADFGQNVSARIGQPVSTHGAGAEPVAELAAGSMLWSVMVARIRRFFGFGRK
ncbi:MAG: 2Fe-2S iron-sulfur cluster binding domain-containing protein [Betaproteobacteria bacterium]|nr:2Fe-2S iron-sulfur cluster binding domain-containing protein [Betaproteobacteria bacterium]